MNNNNNKLKSEPSNLDVIKKSFMHEGISTFNNFFNPEECKSLLDKVSSTRNLENIFLTEEEFKRNPQHKGTNPRPGRNLAEKLDTEFIFGDPSFTSIMVKVLGNRFRIYDYKFVCGVPTSIMPNWVKDICKDNLVNNLGKYIKPKFRDITYFHGIDFHQDIIDYPYRKGDFITVYIYLDKVLPSQAPLHVLNRSHSLGATIFPHSLSKIDGGYLYSDSKDNEVMCPLNILTGNGGDMSFWHSFTLHGTQPQNDDESRVSLRIIVEANSDEDDKSWLNECNFNISGSMSLSKTRKDISAEGEAEIYGNIINKLK